MKSNNRIIYLVNPKSNDGMSTAAWGKAALQFYIPPKVLVNILTISNLSQFIQEQKPDIIAIAGGDGTVNSVAQAVLKLQNKPLLAVLPLGFGNALSLSLGLDTLEDAINVLQNPKHTITIDVIKTNIPKAPISLFNSSLGFDALTVHYHHKDRYIGLRSYFLSGIRSFLDHQKKELTITINKSLTIRAKTTSIVVANGPLIGKNYVVAENASFTDGFLDCTIFSSKYAFISNLRLKGFHHPFITKNGKITFKAKHLRIEGDPYLQVDGDPIFHSGKLEFSIQSKALTFLCKPV